MASKMIIGVAATAAIMMMQFTSAEGRIEERSRHPTPLYLTASDLEDIYNEYRDKGGPDSVEEITKLVEKLNPVRDSVAFILLDPGSGTAWMMRQEGALGAPVPIPGWEQEEKKVRSAEVWCSQVLTGNAQYYADRQSIASGQASPEQAIASIDKYRNNVSAQKLNDLENDVYDYVLGNHDKIAVLEQKKPELYAKIGLFRQPFDRKRIITKVAANHVFKAVTAIKVYDNAPADLMLAYNAFGAAAQDMEKWDAIIAEFADNIK